MGNLIPFDGEVSNGEGMVNQASLTGESVPVRRTLGSVVYAGTVLEEGELTNLVKQTGGSSRYEKITAMIEESEKLKSGLESKAEHLADRLVPYSLGGTALTYLLTRNATKALSILMVDFSCALKLAMPISVLSAIREANQHKITVKGGKYLEAVAEANTIVFDKTGTLTSGKLSVNKVNTVGSYSADEVLALAAASEKYSAHPIASAIREKANGLELPELSDYSESAGHGTRAVYNGKTIQCGGSKILSDEQKKIANKDDSVFVIYDGQLIGSLNVSDTVRPEAKEVISQLKALGVKNTVMLTGDRQQPAENVKNELGLSECHAELLPAQKLELFKGLKSKSKGACFVGDGINDAPVLSASDCGIAMGFGSEAAIEASDAVLASGTLKQLPKAIKIARSVINTVKGNIIFALSIKALVIILAAFGLAQIWMSVIADTGVSVVCVLIAARLLKKKY